MQDNVLKILNGINSDINYLEESGLMTNEKMDSLQIMQLVVELEEKFNIDIDAVDIQPKNFDSVKKICLLVERYQKR